MYYVGNEFFSHIHKTDFIKEFPYLPRCEKCFPKNKPYSKTEKQLADFCKQFFPNIQTNNRTLIHPYELDIVVPDLKLAIEYNGDYWHKNKPLGYHEMKTNMCKNIGFTLIHIWEHDWINNKEKIKQKLIKIFQTKNINNNEFKNND